MTLSALIRGKVATATPATLATDTTHPPRTVATVATVAVAKPSNEAPRLAPELARRVEDMAKRWGYDAEELADALQAARHDPEGWRFIVEDDEKNGRLYRARMGIPEPGEAVRCADCRHYRRTEHHPQLGTCAAGQPMAAAAAGLWDNTPRHCEAFGWRRTKN